MPTKETKMLMFNGKNVSKEIPHHFSNPVTREKILAPVKEVFPLDHKTGRAHKSFSLESRAAFKSG